ncbi:MAG: peptidylprolyl isomerase [Planctomycetota bacterium]|nr:MAG: peptidylprolyl isomerase [Planctomycetota bacterium]
MKTTMGDVYIELFAKDAPKTVENFIQLAEGKKEFKDVKTEKMVKRPFYDGLTFHRVIKNFMIQGGCPKGDGTGGPGYFFEDEINAKSLGLDKIKAIDPKKGPHPILLIRSRQEFLLRIVRPLFKKMGINSKEEYQKRAQEFQKALLSLTVKDCLELMGYHFHTNIKSHHPKRGMIAMANAGPNTNGSQFFILVRDAPWLTGKHTVFGKVIHGMDVVDKISRVPVGPQAKPLKPVKIISIRLFKGKIPSSSKNKEEKDQKKEEKAPAENGEK